mgnify:CR=1 FL=1
MDNKVKYQYQTDFFSSADYDSSSNLHTHLKGILNNEGGMGWRVVSTWAGRQQPYKNAPNVEEGIYVLYERPYTGEFPE